MDERTITEAGGTLFMKGVEFYGSCLKLVPFGWEYWNVDVAALADCMFCMIYRTYPDNGSADRIFMDWLDAQIYAWEDHWMQTGSGSGALKELPSAIT